ncbi:MAG: hypothetical protein M1830_002388 [Pleopsidium flavum]|nr:MAG: hypothetical protein M1830_002388 [Pleopsidium flavum]
MFSTTLSRPHSARKRMISNIYSKSYINASPQLHAISQTLIFDRLLRLIQHAGDGTSLDVLELNFAVTMDFINAYLFGLSNGTNFLQEEKTKRDWLSLYQSRKQYTFWSQELPNLTAWLARIGIRLVPKWVDAANREIEAWCMQMCDAAETTIATSSAEKQNPESEPIVYRQLKNALSSDISKSAPTPTSPPTPNQRLLLASEMLDHLAAGHETSGITLTYLMHELSQRPHLQSRLRAELLTLSLPLRYPSKTRTLPSPKDLDALPLLHAVLMETLRLRSAIPGGQPRITPSSTTTLGKFTDIPPGVRVNAQAYSLHRNAEVFPDPEVWRPERWLDGSREGGDAKSRWFWAFGSGGRMCVGSNFAMHEMKLIVTAIYTNFRTSIVDETGIEQVDSYVAGPTRNMLMLRFEHV